MCDAATPASIREELEKKPTQTGKGCHKGKKTSASHTAETRGQRTKSEEKHFAISHTFTPEGRMRLLIPQNSVNIICLCNYDVIAQDYHMDTNTAV